MEKAQLSGFTFHDMRHTYGSLLLEAGANLPYVAEMMGHSSVMITAKVYAHLLNRKMKQECVDRLETLCSGKPILLRKETQPQPQLPAPQPPATQAQPEYVC